MTLNQLKEYFESFPDNTEFEYSLSYPFSWRGSYDEVAFSIENTSSTKEHMLSVIELAYAQTFHGYKGGDYRYNDWTPVNFEEDYASYTDGIYLQNFTFQFLFGKKITE